MVNEISNTELKIINAAITVFVKKGYDGARMQEIADEADINKSLLHYYFRSKDKLFERVFTNVFSEVIVSISQIVENASTTEELLVPFVSNYIKLLKTKPYLPNFVLHEINRKPSVMVDLIKRVGVNKSHLIELLSKEGNRTDIRDFNPIHIIVNVLAMSVFPFVAAPIIKGFIFYGDESAFEHFVDEREEHIINFVKSAIFKNPD